MAASGNGTTPSLDVRLTRSQSGNILDIDFEFGAQGEPQPLIRSAGDTFARK